MASADHDCLEVPLGQPHHAAPSPDPIAVAQASHAVPTASRILQAYRLCAPLLTGMLSIVASRGLLSLASIADSRRLPTLTDTHAPRTDYARPSFLDVAKRLLRLLKFRARPPLLACFGRWSSFFRYLLAE